MRPSGVTTSRLGFGASASTGACGFDATGEGEGNLATSANLCSGFEAGSCASPVCLPISGVAGNDAAAAAYEAVAVEVSARFNQSRGGVMMPQTFAGFSSSTPTCCNSREVCDGCSERILARTAGGLGSTLKPTTCSVTQVSTPQSWREG